jgi:glycosyltransferase involved in cell wall biosynthesis
VRIALLGTRGIPGNYGGFETFAEQLSKRLVARNHSVTVYCREKHSSPTFEGVSLVNLPTIRHKYFDTLAHTFLSTIHLLFQPCDVALYCNAANALFIALPRLRGLPVALNVDGIERKRKKWNALARTWYHLSEFLATFIPNVIVTDAETIHRYYLETYRKQSTFIAYGAETSRAATHGTLDRLGLEPNRYFLYVSRMEPENNALMVRRAFERVDTPMRLALVGDAPHAAEYIREVRNTKDPRVVMPGAIYGQGYRELDSFCFAYVHATEVGGTHPALIEAMGCGALVIYRNTPENAEVADGCGLPFENEDDLVRQLQNVLAMTAGQRLAYQQKAEQRARERYSWDAVTDAYEALLQGLSSAHRPRG